MLPISLVDSKELHELIRVIAIQFSIPPRYNVVNSLIPKTINLIGTVINTSFDSLLSVTDIWSIRQVRSYLGVTGHTIDKDFNINSFLLGCKRFHRRHTADNIGLNFESIIFTYPSLSQKIDYVITDNAANMPAAFSLPGFEGFNCVNESEEFDDVEFEDVRPVADDSESNLRSEFLPKHLRCFAHSLQLVIKHGIKYNTRLTEVLSKVKKIVGHIRSSCIATDFLENEPKPQAANETRWYSQLRMVRSIANVDKCKLDSVPSINHKESLILTVRERLMLQEFVEIMSAFKEATQRVQGEKIIA